MKIIQKHFLLCKSSALIIWVLALFAHPAVAGGVESAPAFPNVEKAVTLAIKAHSDKNPVEVGHEVKTHYFTWLAKEDQLGISDEVRGHFQKAVNKAEEKMDEGEADISQSTITKLKLGLAGSKNDVIQFTSEIKIAQRHLAYWMGMEVPENAEPGEPGFDAIDFPHTSLNGFLKAKGLDNNFSNDKLLKLDEMAILINRARQKLTLARENRKSTRALLVTEVANYDFGIGSEGDLFEALVIYTRVLVGYYDAILDFNLKVLDMEKLARLP